VAVRVGKAAAQHRPDLIDAVGELEAAILHMDAGVAVGTKRPPTWTKRALTPPLHRRGPRPRPGTSASGAARSAPCR
jgi:hypothetical protein